MLPATAAQTQDPAQPQARPAAVMVLLKDQTSAVERLRAERNTAAAEIDNLRLTIRRLLRARAEKLDPDQLRGPSVARPASGRPSSGLRGS